MKRNKTFCLDSEVCDALEQEENQSALVEHALKEFFKSRGPLTLAELKEKIKEYRKAEELKTLFASDPRAAREQAFLQIKEAEQAYKADDSAENLNALVKKKRIYTELLIQK